VPVADGKAELGPPPSKRRKRKLLKLRGPDFLKKRPTECDAHHTCVSGRCGRLSRQHTTSRGSACDGSIIVRPVAWKLNMSLSLPEKISAFLMRNSGRLYCDTCIQERLGLRWRQQVQLVTATLAVTNDYARQWNRCCVCQLERLVTQAISDPFTPGDQGAQAGKRGGNGSASGAATCAASQLVGKRARALVREHLKHGPRPGAQIEIAAKAAEIPERSLIAAATALGVRTQRGQWWIPRRADTRRDESRLPG
jgi:hypothetical protein